MSEPIDNNNNHNGTNNNNTNGQPTERLIIGLNKSLNSSTGISKESSAVDNSPPPSSNINNNNNTTFKTGALPKSNRSGALSPLGVREKQRSVSFAPVVQEYQNDNVNSNQDNNNNNNSNNNNNNNNSTITNITTTTGQRSYSFSGVNVNNDQINQHNINSLLTNLNNVSIERQKFSKLGGNSEIFQFDEEYEDELQEIETKHQQEQSNQQQQETIITTRELPDDDDDDNNNGRTVDDGSNRSRSNGLMQEPKLGTSLPVQIPSRIAQSLASNKNTLIPNIAFESEKKKYVTPRQSWVDTLKDDKDDISSSFAVPQSLSRKPKSYI